MVRKSAHHAEIPRFQNHKGALALSQLPKIMVKPMGKAPAANAVLNPKAASSRRTPKRAMRAKNQQLVIPSEVEESRGETLRHIVRSNQN